MTQIPTIHRADVTGFRERYYEPEQPVLVQRVVENALSAEELCQQINGRIAEDPTASLQTLCWDVQPRVIDGICAAPAIVQRVLDEGCAFTRKNLVRVWFNKRGHQTLWHYDGHSLHIFTLQLKGRKRWRIVAPETPLMAAPFTSVSLWGDHALEGRRCYEFETGEGDLVFVPRHWCHNVVALDDLNININWVLTPKRPADFNPTACREAELTWLKARTRFLWPSSVRQYNEEYAGVGRPAIELLTRSVSVRAGITRAIKELLKVPLLVPAYFSQRCYLQAATRSNRVLRELVNRELSTGQHASL